MKLLSKIQKELKAPKSQFNKFGGYRYRSCEDILEAVKPLLGEAVLTITDEIVLIGDRYYIKATATILEKPESVSVSAYARESLDRKGMDVAQITGATSSYARKYALNGLLAIDDAKDADSTNEHSEDKIEKSKPNGKPAFGKPTLDKSVFGKPLQTVTPTVRTFGTSTAKFTPTPTAEAPKPELFSKVGQRRKDILEKTDKAGWPFPRPRPTSWTPSWNIATLRPGKPRREKAKNKYQPDY